MMNFLTFALVVVQALRLDVATVALKPPVGTASIIGRAVCADSTWLLTKDESLIRIDHKSSRVTIRRIGGMKSDRGWGLACLSDGALWTLETPRTLTRISDDGAVVERLDLFLPRVTMFGFRDRLVFLQLPLATAGPILAMSPARGAAEARGWAGLLARPPAAGALPLASNLVTCGIAGANVLPCWFADDSRASLSDGTVSRSVSFPFLRAAGIDQSAPIRDLAVAPGGGMWLLAAATDMVNGRRVGTRIIRTDAAGVERRSTALPLPARAIVSATDAECALLTATGVLLRVSAR